VTTTVSMPGQTDRVAVSIAQGVGTIEFDNVARHNSLTPRMAEQACDAVAVLKADDAVRVIVLRGAGKHAFISGADVRVFDRALAGGEGKYSILELVSALEGLEKPVVAVVRGWCLGGGMMIALTADMRIASSDAQFGIPASKLGMGYPYQAVAQLVGATGSSMASEMLLTGEPIPAAEALRCGLASRVVSAGELDAAVEKLTSTLVLNAPLSMRAAKHCVRAAMAAMDSQRTERCDRAVGDCFSSADLSEGLSAFMEKRAPRFSGS
jgi:enoyl-CoA hydratase